MSWEDISSAVLAKAPTAGPILNIVEKYWGDGKLTENVASEFVAAYAQGDYVAAQKVLYSTMSADDLLASQNAANSALAQNIATETQIFNFFKDVEAAILKVALGAALSVVGL
jgi:hypothetical protein